MQELDAKQLLELKAELELQRIQLQQQIDRSQAATATVNLDQTLVGRVSRMDAMQQQNVALSTQQRASQRLQKVAAALRAFADEEYGYCRRCDECIGYGRLKAQPEANLCINCQDLMDNR